MLREPRHYLTVSALLMLQLSLTNVYLPFLSPEILLLVKMNAKYCLKSSHSYLSVKPYWSKAFQLS